jgi:hypothetical protein
MHRFAGLTAGCRRPTMPAMDRSDATPPERPVRDEPALQTWLELRQRLQLLHAELVFLRLMIKLRLGPGRPPIGP